MPFESALYVMDIFFYDGIKVLFQLALTILAENQQRLLECQDDGDAILVLSSYMESIGDEPTENEKKIVKLIRKSYENFNSISEEEISRLRLKHRLKVVQNLGESILHSAAKNTLKYTSFTEDQIKDLFYVFKVRRKTNEFDFPLKLIDQDASRLSLTEAVDGQKLAYETYRIGRQEHLTLWKYLSPWAIGEKDEILADRLFDVRRLFSHRI